MNPRIFTRMSAMPIILAIILLIFAPFTITLTSAEVTDLTVPHVVAQGDTLSISGKASAGEVVWIDSSFEISLPVSDGKYDDEFIGIDFPEGEKNFSVIAKNIKNITVSLSPVEIGTVTITCSGQTMTIVYGDAMDYPLDESIDERGVAEFSVSLPKLIEIPPPLGNITLDIIGKKDIKISGAAADNATSVNLNVGMSIKVTADSEGDFTLDIDTEGVPPGKFLITTGEIEKTVEVVEESAEPTPTPTPSPTPSSDGGDGASDATPTPSPTPTSTSTPTITLAPTATPAAASPTVTPASPAPATVTPSPSPTPSPSASPTQRWIPSFEAVFAIAGLLAVAYLVLRKRE